MRFTRLHHILYECNSLCTKTNEAAAAESVALGDSFPTELRFQTTLWPGNRPSSSPSRCSDESVESKPYGRDPCCNVPIDAVMAMQRTCR